MSSSRRRAASAAGRDVERARTIRVEGAAEHNLADLDVTFGPGLTAVVGVSGSGKSSLVFDTVYAEARRRLMETLALGSPWLRVPPPRVRRLDGLGPAVSIAQNVLNRNPSSTVATAMGLHPFLRIFYARFAEVACGGCGIPVRAVSREQRLGLALELSASADVEVATPLVRGLAGAHAELLAWLRARFATIAVDGMAWSGGALDPDRPHTIVVTVARLARGAAPAVVRAALEQADALGATEVMVAGRPLLRAPVCPGCGDWVPPLEPAAFSAGAADTSSHRVAGLTLDQLLARPAAEVARLVDELPLLPAARRLREELRRRLEPLLALGLEHLSLDRPMPTLSRGEAQRVRLAVVLAGRLEGLLHVLDEPTVGLHARDVERLLAAIVALPGPVLMVEHDRHAVALADEVVEIGPAGGAGGGRLIFQGPPAALWKAETPSGRAFSGRGSARRVRRPAGDRLRIVGASARNLRGFTGELPLGRLTVVTGPSGAGKTTLVRDVLLASLRAGAPRGCQALEAPRLRALAVDQSPLGNNPRSNPATYTGLFDRIRKVFAAATGLSAACFTFNRAEGACPQCEGMGAIEVQLPFVAPTWISCESCGGRRYRPESLAARWNGLSIADVLERSVDEARALFAGDGAIGRLLDTLHEVGLGYLELGQPSPDLSGGEAQRVRLARELGGARAGDLVVLDEPTTGLHPADLERLIAVLDGLTARGCTVVAVEHQADLIAAADWELELGPGGGPHGGALIHCGEPRAPAALEVRPRAQARLRPPAADAIGIRGARAHNLQAVDVDLIKGRFTVVTGVSGSGKSSLVRDVLGAEATRRLLECLSVYERQSAREGPEAPVDGLTGLGPTIVLDSARPSSGPRATVGGSSDLDRLLALLLALGGERTCLGCGSSARRRSPAPDSPWDCSGCAAVMAPAEPRHLMGLAANAWCRRCFGLGSRRQLVEDKLIRRPDLPICGGCLYSPGYYPRNYLCTPGTGGNGSLLAFAARHRFDPQRTPWNQLTPAARQAFLFGDPQPFPLTRRDGKPSLVAYGAREGDQWYWRGVLDPETDVGGRYSEAVVCPACAGKRLRPELLTLRLDGRDRGDLVAMPLADLEPLVAALDLTHAIALAARATALGRLAFLRRVGLGYLHLDRATWTLSGGEAQRVRLASVLGGGLCGMTVLMDEPSRGLHPSEVAVVAAALRELSAAGNTVIAVEHDPVLIGAADHIVEMGPGSGRAGGRVTDGALTRRLLDGELRVPRRARRRDPAGWMRVLGARENNLRGDPVRIPLGVLVGVCGVSGSGKSSLVIDTIGIALAPPKLTTSLARDQRIAAGAHDAIEGRPARVVVAEPSRASVSSPGAYLGLVAALRGAYAESAEAAEAGVTAADLARGCDRCKGRGSWREPMEFLPAVAQRCDACDGSGYMREAAALMVRGRTLPQLEALTLAELAEVWGDLQAVARPCAAAIRLGLGYLSVRQPDWSLSGGEAQRLKLARELERPHAAPTLYLFDEPTLGLHAADVLLLVQVLDELVGAGHTVLAVEHDAQLLAACDWLIELGPGAGAAGGQVIFEGPPEQLAAAATATAPYLRQALS